jgi:hypothetical protein
VSVYKNLNFLPALNLCMIQAGYKVYVLMWKKLLICCEF